MRLRCFKNSIELADGRILDMTQVYQYWYQTRDYPEDWEGEEPIFAIDGELVDRENVLREISIEELEKFIDSATEDKDFTAPGPDAEDQL